MDQPDDTVYYEYKPFEELVDKGEIKTGRAIRVLESEDPGLWYYRVYIMKKDGLVDLIDEKVYDPKDVLSQENAPYGWQLGGMAYCHKPWFDY